MLELVRLRGQWAGLTLNCVASVVIVVTTPACAFRSKHIASYHVRIGGNEVRGRMRLVEGTASTSSISVKIGVGGTRYRIQARIIDIAAHPALRCRRPPSLAKAHVERGFDLADSFGTFREKHLYFKVLKMSAFSLQQRLCQAPIVHHPKSAAVAHPAET